MAPMANQQGHSSSSSSSSSSVTQDPWTYDVFVSFRGKDTRTNFTDHLYKALSDKGIYTFIDRELIGGEKISPALLEAIEESRISLIVFSENYASSRWCLDELVEILRCKSSTNQIVWPIFYKVDPSHVRNQTNSFGDAFADMNCRFKDNTEKVLRWRSALREAASLKGYTCKAGESEATFINHIVEEIVVLVLNRTYLNVAKYPVGIHSCVRAVEMLLCAGGNGRRIVGIWGTSGIGKTTIAKAVYNAIAHKFEGCCFLADVRENSMPHGGLIQLQETLLQEILGGKKLKIVSADKGISIIQKLLRHKRILLILDDVNQLEQLDNLAGVGWFGEGTRVIITTQDSGLLKCYGIELIYEVQKLYDNQALELFSLNAFGRNEPPNNYLELAKRAIAYAQGLPLALTLLGSHLRNKGIHRWQAILDGYEGEPYTGVQKILRKSYDALDNSVQQVFLDMACFFKGEDKDYVMQILSSKHKASQDCIEVLVEKAMITIQYNRILMHDLLEKLGKDIVHEECPIEPGKRSRLWFHEDVYHVLTENSGTRKIKGIMVKFPKPDEIPLNAKSFFGMVNLEIFINCNAVLSGYVEYLPNELRFIDWGRCQLQLLPSNFHARHLVVFNMPCSDIRQLEGFKKFPKLTSINLSGCQFLEKIVDLSGIPNLKYLNLSECKRLVEVDGSVGFLDKLVELDLRECFQLTRFGTRLRLKSLERLYLCDCKRLESFPEIDDKMESLIILDMEGSGIRELPSSIAYLTGLEVLKADYCENLSNASLHRIYGLQRLGELSVKGCRKLLTFGNEVNFEGSSSYTELQLLSNSSNFSDDNSLSLALPRLRFFFLGGCNLSESDFLPPLDCWSTLEELDLSGNNFVSLPECISKFVNLLSLRLCGCKRLREIPEVLPPKLTSATLNSCTSLETFPKLSRGLQHLYLTNCFKLCGCDITENILLNQVSSQSSTIEIIVPGTEAPKWFSCCKEATVFEDPFSDNQGEYVAECEVCFEIPPNLEWETSRLALCAVFDLMTYHGCQFCAKILINGKQVNEIWIWAEYGIKLEETHVWLNCSPLLDPNKNMVEGPMRLQQGNMCQVLFYNYGAGPMTRCGVHLLGHQVGDVSGTGIMVVDDDIHCHYQDELVSLSLTSTSGVGKRPRGSDTIAVDNHGPNIVMDHDHEEQYLTLFSEPADHPKRRHIDIDEEQNLTY
ncbi:hypothetical protein L3X38_010646 [Prunus dulcis]|uniref:TIR domain-containing protein n=1 Tax=Prunus dulcis TaxID=3755 RepID=A0AAD4WFU4_PRUDU|nr:hypothetical protein L3X38_010646 [Prunus dulcis]